MSKPKSPQVRRIFYLTLLCAFLGFGIKAFLLSPLYVSLASDVAYADTWWVNILYYLTDGGLIDLAVFAVCYPATLYAVRMNGLRPTIHIPLVYSFLTLFKFAANNIVNAISDGALPDIEEFLSFDLPFILAMFAMEWLQYILVVLIALLVRWLYDSRIQTAEGMRMLPRSQQVEYPLPPPDFPFKKFYVRRNALQRGALLSAVVIVLGRVIMHLIYQVTLFTNTGSSDGWVVMLYDLISDLFIGVIFYLVSLLVLMYLHRKRDHTE